MQFKQQVIAYSIANSNRSAARRFNVDPKRIREWKSKAEAIKSTKQGKKKLEGGGRKCMDQQLEEDLVLWIYEQRSKMLHVSRKMIIFRAKKMFNEKSDNPAVQDSLLQAEVGAKSL